MLNLSNLIGGNNLQFASVVLSGAPGVNSQTFPNAWFKVPFNGVLANPYNLITLNTSLSTLTMPAGLYSITVSPQGLKTLNQVNVNTRITVNNVTSIKWPQYELESPAGGYDPNSLIQPAGLYISNSSSVALEQYWDDTTQYIGVPPNGINDGESNIFYRMDIWKLR